MMVIIVERRMRCVTMTVRRNEVVAIGGDDSGDGGGWKTICRVRSI